eukprot:m.150160 g.150160  ORF g.150160 m.150160 type:complete len:377 (-) comp14223_c0_seq2:369-1499(-)
MPPPPPPPPGPPPPVAAAAKPTVVDEKEKGLGIDELIALRKAKEAAHIPGRPKTPPPAGPEVFYDVSTSWISPRDLFNLLQFGSQLLVVDVRDAAAFESGHVRSAINWYFARVGGEDMLEVEKQLKPRFRHRRMFHVAIYDQSSTQDNVSPTLAAAIQALESERRVQRGVSIIDGGFAAFASRHPYLVTGTPSFSDAEFPSEIVDDFLYCGSWETANNPAALELLGVRYIINATASCDMPYPDKFEYLHCPLDDDAREDMTQFFDASLAHLKQAKAEGVKALVHCKMGMSRSSTLVLLYLMVEHKMSLKAAFDLTLARRPYINPNPGFLAQLAKKELELYGTQTIRFPDDGQPLSMQTLYEWKLADGSWVQRVITR